MQPETAVRGHHSINAECNRQSKIVKILPDCLLGYGLDHRLYIAVGKSPPPVAPLSILERLRYVIIYKEAVETDFVVYFHGPVHVHVTRIDELLMELRHLARHVTKVDV